MLRLTVAARSNFQLWEVLPGGQARGRPTAQHSRILAASCGRPERQLSYRILSRCGDVPGSKVTSTTKAATAKR